MEPKIMQDILNQLKAQNYLSIANNTLVDEKTRLMATNLALAELGLPVIDLGKIANQAYQEPAGLTNDPNDLNYRIP